ncbi:MAG: YbhB/YbcL family Raf kinase inhibitor-like protein [Azospirillum sp.]|nr:YbhB/YbcL family Raf kinase inhibitor-like protein [Azospirillum sp.]
MKSAAAAIIAMMLAPPVFAADFALTSTDILSGQRLNQAQVLNGFGCTGANISPHLAWTDPPAGTKSFVITVYDPDAPTGSGWWHWVVFDIPSTVRSLDAGASRDKTKLPAGSVESRTDFGAPGFGGACPPPGAKPHRYIFKITALKVEKLDLPADASAALVGYMTNLNALTSAQIEATYGR